MYHVFRIIFVTIVASVLGHTAQAHIGVRYIDLPPYEALSNAQAANKMLLVEFYAPWNNRSRWMHEKVLADSTVGEFVNKHFVTTMVDTQTATGAQMALDYEVVAYPAIVVFDTRGNVLDKINTPLDDEDFKSRLLSVIMAAEGSSGWQLQMCFSSIESGDLEQAQTYAAQYLELHTAPQLVNSVVWPLFANNAITYYGSKTYVYMVDNIDFMREQLGSELVDRHLSQKMLDAMLPYAIGSEEFDSVRMKELVASADKLKLVALSQNLKQLYALVCYKQDADINEVIRTTSYLINHLPESMSLQLTLGLDVVAQKGTKEQRTAAKKIVTQTIAGINQSAAYQLLENLRSRLK